MNVRKFFSYVLIRLEFDFLEKSRYFVLRSVTEHVTL